ncbi:MAG: hypothetical protein LOD92_08330 [Bacillales bacterium]
MTWRPRIVPFATTVALAALGAAPVVAQDPKAELAAAIDGAADEYAAIARRIWSLAELGYMEEQSSALLRSRLEAAISEYLGRPITLSITTGTPPRPTPAQVRLANENERMRRAFRTVQTRLGITSLNPFAAIGLETAYRHGEEWLEELLDYLYENIMTAKDFIDREIPGISVMIPDATYLIWLDCRKLGLSDREIWDALTKKGKLGLEPGPKYGPGGEGFLRMNVGCSRKILMEGLNRLKKAFSS